MRRNPHESRMRTGRWPLFILIASSPLLDAQEASSNPFWNDGKPFYDRQQAGLGTIVAVAVNGNVIGGDKFSSDGGVTWKPMTGKPRGAHYYTIDETAAHLIARDGEREPGLPLLQWRSKDHGATWEKEEAVLLADSNGWLSSLSACEPGITLRHGEHKGRLLAASRVFVGYDNRKNYEYHYSNALYSDDGGKTWNPSSPFPHVGTGEAGLVELSNGVIYYNSRCHVRMGRRMVAYSHDGGATWRELRECDYLPDGPPAFYGCKGGLVRLPLEGRDVLVFSMNDVPGNKDTSRHTPAGRENLTVWASFDGGRTWPVKRLVHKEGGYSSLAAGRTGTPSEGLIYLTCIDGSFSRFNLAWITHGRDWKEFLDPPSE